MHHTYSELVKDRVRGGRFEKRDRHTVRNTGKQIDWQVDRHTLTPPLPTPMQTYT